MLFQNAYDNVEDYCLKISKQPSNWSFNKRSLEHILNCQKLVRSGSLSRMGKNPDDFQTKNELEWPSWLRDEVQIWKDTSSNFTRHLAKLGDPTSLQGFWCLSSPTSIYMQ